MCEMKKSNDEPLLENMPLISIVIPAFNSMIGNMNIERLLKSIFNQTYRNFEVIVVDNFSKDKTLEICKRFPVTFIQAKSTISEADNIGLEMAEGEYFLFLDSDMELPPLFLEECVRIIQSESVDCLQMKFICVESEEASLLNYVELRNLELQLGAASLNIYFYSRDIVQNTRFPESEKPLVGEEYIFRSRILSKDPKIGLMKEKVLHYHNPSFAWVVRRSWKYGKWFRETKKHLSRREAMEFFKYNSIFKRHSLGSFYDIVKKKPSKVLPFALFICIKYASFILGYTSELTNM